MDLNKDLIKGKKKKQVFFYITLNLSQSQCGQICFDMCNFVNMPEYT